MIPSTSLIILCWLFFYVYWAISAIGVKKNVKGTSWWQRGAGIRILLLVVVISLYRLRVSRQLFRNVGIAFFSPAMHGVGVVVCALGMAVAIWARRHLGRNWGTPMSFKEGHELVTTGPYRFVRHPIYAGILFAILGTALVVGGLGLVAFIMICPLLVYSAREEERLMMRQFPNEYPQYRKRTKALIPFVW